MVAMSGAPATDDRSPFVGRSRELRPLASLIDGTLEGRNAATVVVVGEAGIGKTRLIREFVDHAAERRPGRATRYRPAPHPPWFRPARMGACTDARRAFGRLASPS